MEYLKIASTPESIKDANFIEINHAYNEMNAEIADYSNSIATPPPITKANTPMYPERQIDVFIDKDKEKTSTDEEESFHDACRRYREATRGAKNDEERQDAINKFRCGK